MGPYRFGRDPRQQQARQVAVGQLVLAGPTQDQLGRTIDALVLMLVAGVASRQGTERHQPRHETEIGVRFAGPDKLVHLIAEGEAPPRRWWGFAERLDRAGQINDDFSNGNQLAALTLHYGFILPQPRFTG